VGTFIKALGISVFVFMCSLDRLVADDAVARFYSGRQVNIFVGFGAGGSASLYAEALAHHMSRFLPGAPTIVVQHMPGAGGLTVANYIANTAPRDGTAFAITGRTAGIEPLMGNSNAKFDGIKFNWLGSANIENTTCLSWHTSPVTSLQDAMQHELIIGGTGSGATEVIFPKAINELIGTKFKIVMGYPGSTEMDLAMERGELQGNCGLGWTVIKSRRKDWLQNNKINILFQMALDKHPDLPDVPLILDYAKTPEDRKILEFLFAPQKIGRPFFAPPDVPKERVAALRMAFTKTLGDARFLAEAQKAGLEVQLVDGEEVQKIIKAMYETPTNILTRIRNIAGH
jgi:tripartite-type tricarboxylate transporter receptor subunit TctC